jgi:hypothetical protein
VPVAEGPSPADDPDGQPLEAASLKVIPMIAMMTTGAAPG